MKYQTEELEGNALDEACAIAERRAYRRRNDGKITVSDPGTLGGLADVCIEGYRPSADWSWGGPIIERERIGLDAYSTVRWNAFHPQRVEGTCGVGPSPLVAAMRAYVASKLGDEVELPD